MRRAGGEKREKKQPKGVVGIEDVRRWEGAIGEAVGNERNSEGDATGSKGGQPLWSLIEFFKIDAAPVDFIGRPGTFAPPPCLLRWG